MKPFYSLLIALLLAPAFSVSAQEVDILWQGETYTPPFYEGRALWSNQSRITLVAIPQGLGNPTSLNYKWIKNGTVLGNVSGIGRGSLFFIDTVLSRPQTIEVEIIASDKSVLAKNSVYVVPRPPALAVYENNPLYGFMFHKEISEYDMQSPEVVLAAFPLFFSTSDRSDFSLEYDWASNAGDRNKESSVTYRAPEGGSGSVSVTVRVKSLDNLMQSASKNLLLKFNSENINNFGL